MPVFLPITPMPRGVNGGTKMYIKKYKKAGKTYYFFQAYGPVDPATGKRSRFTRRGFSSAKEAELEYYRLKVELENEGYKKPEKYTFQDVYDLWLEQYRNTVKESTLNKTTNLFKTHILPSLGKYYIDMIKVTHCQEALNTWFKALKNFRVVNSYTGLIFKHAMKLGIIKGNPTQLVTMPVRLERVEDEDEISNFLTREDLIILLESIDDQKWATFFRLLAYSGCRRGEALALTWKDINFKESTVNITKTLTLGLNNKIIIQTPKTKKSRRVIPMDFGTMEILKKWKSTQAKNMLKFGFNTMNPQQLVFSNLRNEFINPQKVGQKLNLFIRRAGVKEITPHGFRHTHCSILFEAGATLKEVQDRLGHSDIQTTMNIYTHITEKKKEETAQKFADYMSGLSS